MHTIDKETVRAVTLWYDWAQRLTHGEAPSNFLPLYGFDPYNQTKSKDDKLKKIAGQDVLNQLQDEQTDAKDDNEEEDLRAKQRKLQMTEWSEDEFEEEDLHGVPQFPDVDLNNNET